jgi:hypothetical protein
MYIHKYMHKVFHVKHISILHPPLAQAAGRAFAPSARPSSPASNTGGWQANSEHTTANDRPPPSAGRFGIVAANSRRQVRRHRLIRVQAQHRRTQPQRTHRRPI